MNVAGTAVVHAPADDVCPMQGLTPQDLVKYVGDAYGFTTKPATAPNSPVEQAFLSFQSGKLVKDGTDYPIQVLMLAPQDDAVTAATTEIADVVLHDLASRLDRDLHYRYGERQWPRRYFCAVVVEFDRAIEESMPVFGRIEKILNRALSRPDMPFKPKVLTFGGGDIVQPQMLLESIERSDFTIQRRAGAPYSSNRYFCSGPFKTTELIHILEQIEAALSD